VASLALSERVAARQWLGIVVFLVGVVVYFGPATVAAGERIGLLVALLGLVANAAAAVIGRAVNRTATIEPLLVTLVSMSVGALALLSVGLTVEGVPTLSLGGWMVVVWLAVVNTAFAFTLWNTTLRHLSAVESSVVNNTMLIQIAILAWVFLGEALQAVQIAGIVLAVLGTLAVQRRPIAAPRARGPRTVEDVSER
jgi:drug/metabolite transporter (DMT)-like permease